MEYILIFISAIFVNNIVLSQFLGICPFLGVPRRCGNCDGYECGSCFRTDYRYHRYIPDSEVCVGCLSDWDICRQSLLFWLLSD